MSEDGNLKKCAISINWKKLSRKFTDCTSLSFFSTRRKKKVQQINSQATHTYTHTYTHVGSFVAAATLKCGGGWDGYCQSSSSSLLHQCFLHIGLGADKTAVLKLKDCGLLTCTAHIVLEVTVPPQMLGMVVVVVVVTKNEGYFSCIIREEHCFAGPEIRSILISSKASPEQIFHVYIYICIYIF